MANKRIHAGIIRHTIPEPTVFYGSAGEIAEHIGVQIRQVFILLSDPSVLNKRGWKVMTEEEYNLHYQPPKPPKPQKYSSRRMGDDARSNWKITIFKDWNIGDTPPKDASRKFLGTLSEIARFLGCQSSQISRLVNAKLGEGTPYPLKSYKGWRIYRINKHKKHKVMTIRVWDKELKKMVYKREDA